MINSFETDNEVRSYFIDIIRLLYDLNTNLQALGLYYQSNNFIKFQQLRLFVDKNKINLPCCS